MPEKLHRCVQHLKDKGSKVDNPWAVCNASISEQISQIADKYKDALGAERTLDEIVSS